MDKNEPFPGVRRYQRQAVVFFLELKEVVFIRYEGKFSLRVISPAVKLTGKGLARPSPIPHQLVAPV